MMISALKITADSTALSGVASPHDIQHTQGRICRGKRGRNNRKILRDIVGDTKGRERAARHEELFADFDDFDQFGGIGIQIDQIAASLAAWVPVFMATATSACANAGASLVPSPVIATSRPPA